MTTASRAALLPRSRGVRATASKVALLPSSRGEYAVAGLTQESADVASNVLQENHEKHDIIFTDFGFHNHIAHHILTVFALGAPPNIISKHYRGNKSYQRRLRPTDEQMVQRLADPSIFLEHLGQNTKFYPNYLLLFTKQIEAKGYEQVCNEYLFKGDKTANVMFARLYSGILHPLIHLGFGVEFQQPTIIAEALGQTAIHETWLDSFFFEADDAAKQDQSPPRSLVAILDSIRADEELRTAVRRTDNDFIRDGVLARAKPRMIKYASQWRVNTNNLEAAMAEMTNAAAYFTGAAQHSPKQVKFDFFFMHSVNSTIFLPSFLKQSWISPANKAKMLEYKGRMDLCQYASRGAPPLLPDEIRNYTPKRMDSASWDSIIERVNQVDDDGHAAKLIRALAHGQRISRPFEERAEFKIKGDMWLQLGNMDMKITEGKGLAKNKIF